MSNEPELLRDVLARGVRQGLNVEAGLAEDIGRLCADLVADHAETVEPVEPADSAVEAALVEAVGYGANLYIKALLENAGIPRMPIIRPGEDDQRAEAWAKSWSHLGKASASLWSGFFRSALAGVNGDDDCDDDNGGGGE
jgi:hypothetical protein